MAFSELTPKTRKIGPSAVKITYNSKHVVWVEKISFIVIQNWPKMVEWTEMSAREWRSTLPFSAKWAFRPNGLFGQMSYSVKWVFGQMSFRPNEHSTK
jgi:hypothetical protein